MYLIPLSAKSDDENRLIIQLIVQSVGLYHPSDCSPFLPVQVNPLSLVNPIDHFTERKGSWVSRAKFDASNAFFNKIFHFCHLGVRYSSGSYSLKTLSKFMETIQHLPGTQGFAFSISFSAWTLLNLCASFANCGLLHV